jgi:hypothetical protein
MNPALTNACRIPSDMDACITILSIEQVLTNQLNP